MGILVAGRQAQGPRLIHGDASVGGKAGSLGLLLLLLVGIVICLGTEGAPSRRRLCRLPTMIGQRPPRTSGALVFGETHPAGAPGCGGIRGRACQAADGCHTRVSHRLTQ